MSLRRHFWLCAVSGLVFLFLLIPSEAPADNIIVTNTNDSGLGSLRQAITDAEKTPGRDDIFINAAGTIDLLSSLPNITTPMTITGPGADQLAIERSPSALGQFRFFSAVEQTNSNTFGIGDLTISGARAAGLNGGAIMKTGSGNLVVSSVWLTDDRAANGGAVYVDEGQNTIRDSALSGNQSIGGDGGALYATLASASGQDLIQVENTTVEGNSADRSGGGIFAAGTVGAGTQVGLNADTIHANTADAANSGGGGGGTFNGAKAFSVANTLYADNVLRSGTASNCSGSAYTSSGYNLRTISGGCNGFTDSTDLVNADPMLGTFGNNGGPTPTVPLLIGSPALEAGNPAMPADNAFPACPAADQRGTDRIGGTNRCDIGAFERRSPTSTSVVCDPDSIPLGGSTTCTATVTDLSGQGSPTGTVLFVGLGAVFNTIGSCTLSAVSDPSASCAVTYAPPLSGGSSSLDSSVLATYEGGPSGLPSSGTGLLNVVPSTPSVQPSTGPSVKGVVARVRKCKKKFPKGPRRTKCIKKARGA